jgi:transposase-like protein
MYSNEIRDKFIELRAMGLSLERIARQLGINKSTALEWHRRFQHEIAELKAFRLETIRERVAANYEDEIEYASSLLKHIRRMLLERGLQSMSIASLFYAEELAYRRVQSLGALAELPLAPVAQASEPAVSRISDPLTVHTAGQSALDSIGKDAAMAVEASAKAAPASALCEPEGPVPVPNDARVDGASPEGPSGDGASPEGPSVDGASPEGPSADGASPEGHQNPTVSPPEKGG